MSLEKRLSALEGRLKNEGLTVIRVIGGLPSGTGLMEATAGSHRWQQNADEIEDAFADRVTALANATSEKTLVIGGLPCIEKAAATAFNIKV